MIQSRLQGLRVDYMDKLGVLTDHWREDRGSSVARKEAAKCRKQLKDTEECMACHEYCQPINASPRYEGVCRKCGMAFSSMLATKTKIRHRQPVGLLALTRLRDKYLMYDFVPLQLRGDATREEIIKCLDEVIEAKQLLEDYKETLKC